MSPPMRVLITGSTTWTDAQALRRELKDLPSNTVVVTGDCPGIDALAIAVATELGFAVEAMKKNRADRKAFPEASWMGLNERMLAAGIDLVLAFHPDYGKAGCARGTAHLVDLAVAAGVATRTLIC
ncbi:MAG: SLOG family protein [Massilia sp.]